MSRIATDLGFKLMDARAAFDRIDTRDIRSKLNMAVAYDFRDEVIRLLSCYDLSADQAHLRTLLRTAFECGNEDLVQILVQGGADASYALYLAAINNDVTSVRSLLASGVHPDVLECGPIRVAFSAGYSEIFQLLADAGASAPLDDGSGDSDPIEQLIRLTRGITKSQGYHLP